MHLSYHHIVLNHSYLLNFSGSAVQDESISGNFSQSITLLLHLEWEGRGGSNT